MNEPFPYSDAELETLRGYYRDGYETVRRVDGNVLVVLSDAFRNVASWGSFMPSDRYDAVAMDVVSCLHREFWDVEILTDVMILGLSISILCESSDNTLHALRSFAVYHARFTIELVDKATRTTFGRFVAGFQSCRTPIGICGR
jgi:hypothetical protein